MTPEQYAEEMKQANILAAEYAQEHAINTDDVAPLMKAFLAGCEAIINKQIQNQ